MSAGSAGRARRRATAVTRPGRRSGSRRRGGGRARRRRRLRPRRRWATDGRRVAPHDARSTVRPTRPHGHDEAGGDAGRDPAGDVVEAGAGPAEARVAGGAVADHGVQRVHGPVGEHTGGAGERRPTARARRRRRRCSRPPTRRRRGTISFSSSPRRVAPDQRGEHAAGAARGRRAPAPPRYRSRRTRACARRRRHRRPPPVSASAAPAAAPSPTPTAAWTPPPACRDPR